MEASKPVVLYVTIMLPNGLPLRLPIYEGEEIKTKVESVVENWIKNTKDDPKKYDHFVLKEDRCPKCGGVLVERESKYGKFIGCSNYPKCKYTQKK